MPDKHLNLFIMAGGVGSRFWPKSRNAYPKQFIDILGTGSSLLQHTYNRFKDIVLPENIYVVTHQDYYDLVLQQIPELLPYQIICEPSRNNTAPCIAYSSFKIYKRDPKAVMVIVPSDHLILKEEHYRHIICQAVTYAQQHPALVTLGISPTRPDTGFGYIQYDERSTENFTPVTAFREKPARAVAEQYLEQGNYLWNAGMFIWKAADILEAFKQYSPDIYELFQRGLDEYNTGSEAAFIEANYPLSPNISIDYAIMEKARNVFTIRADIGWSDLGTWNSLYEISEKDEGNNVLIGIGKNEIHNSSNCIIHAPFGKMIAIDGLKDYIVVDNENVLLIYPRKKEQEIKEITKSIKEKVLLEYL